MNPRFVARMKFVAVEEAQIPKDGFVSVVNRWWVVTPKNQIMFYGNPKRYGAPQCNANEHITSRIRDKLYPECSIKFIPAVYADFED